MFCMQRTNCRETFMYPERQGSFHNYISVSGSRSIFAVAKRNVNLKTFGEKIIAAHRAYGR